MFVVYPLHLICAGRFGRRLAKTLIVGLDNAEPPRLVYCCEGVEEPVRLRI